MKKRLFALGLACLLLAALFAGCGAKAAHQEAAESVTVPMAAYDAGGAYDYAASEEAAPVPAPAGAEAKIIRTADMDLETTDFDGAVQALAALTGELGGYYEASRLDNDGGRSASYTVRVPSENFRAFLDRVGGVCHVLSVSEYADDVSEAYYDTEGRLKTQQAKLDRLRELLAQAEDMEDMIALESAIADAEQELDYLSGALKHYDSQVDLATISIYLRAVSRLSDVPEPEQSLGQRLTASFKAGLSSFAQWAEELLEALAFSWTWLLLALSVLVIVVLIVRHVIKKKKGK